MAVGLKLRLLKPLANQVGAWTFHRFGTEQGVNQGPCWFLGCSKHLIHVETQLIIRPDGALVGKDLLPSRRRHGLSSKGLHQRKVSNWGLCHQGQTLSIKARQRFKHWSITGGSRRHRQVVSSGSTWSLVLGTHIFCIPRNRRRDFNRRKLLKIDKDNRVPSDPQAKSSSKMTKRQVRPRAAIQDTNILLSEVHKLTWRLDDSSNGVFRRPQTHNVRRPIGVMNNRNLRRATHVTGLHPRGQSDIINGQIGQIQNRGFRQRKSNASMSWNILAFNWSIKARGSIGLSPWKTWSMCLWSWEPTQADWKGAAICPSPQLQDEDHQATQVQGLHWEWQSQLEADDGARAWWSQSPIQHLATGQEHHTSHGWTACHDWIPGPYIHNDIQTLDRSSCAMQWVPCCQASRTNGQDSVRTVQFSGVQNQLIQLRLRQSQGALEQISGMLGCKEALQQPSAEKWSCQNSPPTSTARHPHLFEVQGSLGEVISALTSEGVYEATNHRISPCVLYTFQNDRHWTKQIPGAKCLWQREGPASWKRLARKTTHESGWMRMQTEKLLQHLVITNAHSYHRNVRMHLTKSRSKKSTPISSTHRFHTGMIEPQGTDAKSCTQFDHVPQIVTVAPAISDNILHVINKENGHPSFLNQSALENSDGVTWSRDLERSEKLHLGLVWHGQRCPKMVSSDALTTSATTSTWLPSVVAGSKNQLIGVPASPRSEAIAKQDRGSQNHPKSARAALPAGRAFGHETICQIYVIHVIDLV